MARPIKETVDYIKFTGNESGNVGVIYLEQQFGLAGYAMKFKLWEILLKEPEQRIKLTRVKKSLIAKYMGITINKLEKFIEIATDPEIEVFSLDGEMLYSKEIDERLKSYLNSRERQREYDRNKNGKMAPDGVSWQETQPETGVSCQEMGVSCQETTINGNGNKTETEKESVKKTDKGNLIPRTVPAASVSVNPSFEKNPVSVLEIPEHAEAQLELLKRLDKASNSKKLADFLCRNYPPGLILQWIRIFDWVKIYKPELVKKSKTGWLIEAIKSQNTDHPWSPPQAFEDWERENLQRRRKQESGLPGDDEESDVAVRDLISKSLGMPN